MAKTRKEFYEKVDDDNITVTVKTTDEMRNVRKIDVIKELQHVNQTIVDLNTEKIALELLLTKFE